MKLHELQAKRAEKIAELRKLAKTAETEKRSLNEQEQARFDEVEGEIRQLDKEIRTATVLAEIERRDGTAVPLTDGRDDYAAARRSFSLTRAIAARLEEGRNIDDGREREVSQEIAQRSGKSPEGFMVPLEALLPQHQAERRVLTVAGDGSNLVQTEVMEQEFIDALRPASVAVGLGARTLVDLRGDVALPKNDGTTPAAEWVAENSALTAADHSFTQVTGTPRHLGLLTEVSRKTILQSTPGIEEIVRADFREKLAAGVDLGAMKGSGAPQPTGIVNTSGVQTFDQSSADPNWTSVVNVVADVEATDVPMQSAGWAINAHFKAMLRKVLKVSGDAGAGFILDPDGSLAGWPVAVSSQLQGNPNASPTVDGEAIFGAWDQLILAFWSDADILVNPFETTAYAKGNVQIRGFIDADVLVRHPSAFLHYQNVDLVP